jgi:hypothetical protein
MACWVPYRDSSFHQANSCLLPHILSQQLQSTFNIVQTRMSFTSYYAVVMVKEGIKHIFVCVFQR